MIEAVGAQYLDLFFKRCSELLKPDGRMALQTITIKDQSYRAAVKRVDFIKRYIFPGGFLPSVEAIMGAVRRRTDFRLVRMEDIGSHYVRTLCVCGRRRCGGTGTRRRSSGTPVSSCACTSSISGTARRGLRSARSAMRKCSLPNRRRVDLAVHRPPSSVRAS